MLTILEGSTFCICDEIGDIDGETSGSSRDDTRFLSRLVLRVDGARAAPALVREGRVLLGRVLPPQPGRARACRRTRSRSRASASSARGCRSIWRSGTRAPSRSRFELALEVGTDFADIISVKEHDFALGDPLHAQPLPPPRAGSLRRGARPGRPRGAARATPGRRSSSRGPGSSNGERDPLRLDARAARALGAPRRRRPVADGEESQPLVVERFGEERENVERRRSPRGTLRVPRVRGRLGRPARARSTQSVARPRRAADADGRARSARCPPPACRGS